MRLAAAACLVLALSLVPAAAAGTPTLTKTTPTRVTSVTKSVPEAPLLASASRHTSKQEAIALLLADRKVHDWLERYPPNPTTDATFAQGIWTVNVWSGAAGEVATGLVDDATGTVTEAWTGPQVAWKMARGYRGAFGGAKINSYPVWLGFCAAFLLGLIDWRRPFSLRNADLLVLLSLSASLWFFNRGNVFAAMPLAYPPLGWLLVRCAWIARSDRPTRGAAVWPVWVLAAATVFLAGFRVGLNVQAVQRDRRRVLRCDRRRSHRPRHRPIRALPAGGLSAEMRAGGCRRGGARSRPAERQVRDREPTR